LITAVTGSGALGFAGALVVLCGGALISGIGVVNGFFEGGSAYPFIPFLRRPIPSLSFPFLFGFFYFLWKGISDRTSRAWSWAAAGGLCFGALVYSYFYLWTSAASVLAALIVAVAIGGKAARKELTFLLQTAAVSALTMVPYLLMLAGRNKMADEAQLLVLTRTPDLWRNVEIAGFIVIAASAAIWIFWREAETRRMAAFAAALAASPIIVFNQQVVTGRSLQPFHYEFYVINYVTLLAVVIVIAIVWHRFLFSRRKLSRGAATIVAAAAIIWGCLETTETTKFWDDVNIARDKAMPVDTRLRELAQETGSGREMTTLNLESLQADGQTTVAPQPVLWARHQNTFAGLTSIAESRERYYKLLYYSGADGEWLRMALTGCRDIEACMALFGWDRFNGRLSANARPLTMPEVDEESARFDRFCRSFSAREAAEPRLWFLITDTSIEGLENVDKWYERDDGELHGDYILYRLKLRETQ
jgi:hypothetical protein